LNITVVFCFCFSSSGTYSSHVIFQTLFFFRIIPQAILSRWALQIGGKIYWLVWGLIGLLFPIAWPISKILDLVLGHRSGVYYKRAQLKEFVSYHAASAFQNQENGTNEGKGADEESGEGSTSGSESDDGGLPKEERLTNDEVMIIKGALDLTSKNVMDSMTPVEKVFSLDEATIIDPRTLQTILDAGHSRIPLWRDDPSNFVGMLLVKSLNLNFILEGGIIARADVKELPLVDASTPLYTMLNIFQTGRSHMAAILAPGFTNKAVGIITLEDIIEELIQEEIEDEMDLWRREHIRVRKTPSRRNSQNFSEADGDHHHHHRRRHHSSSMSRSKSGQFSHSRRDRRDQQKRTRRGREVALGLDSDDPGIESDIGPSVGGSFSDVESSSSRRNYLSPDSSSSSQAISTNPKISLTKDPSSPSIIIVPPPHSDNDTEMVQLDL
jgi:CBS domain containing-hemolysin-like protein